VHRQLYALLVVCCIALATSACAPNLITPRQTIETAADAAPAGVTGVFDMQVRATGEQDGNASLNSEVDYRDQRNLTIELAPDVVAALQARYGIASVGYFSGKHIHVTGEARRVTVWFFSDGKQTDKYYYQTHVRVTDVNQIEIVA